MSARLYLASGSPRRAELLAQIGVAFTALKASAIDETPRGGETPEDYVRRLAREKTRAGQRALGQSEPGTVVVMGADTAIAVDGRILGKPKDDRHALAMLEVLSGREHRVFSAVCLGRGDQYRLALSCSRVCFRNLDRAHLHAYVATGEGRDKAGAYGIQGLGAALVASLAGSYSGVVGLPLEQTVPLLEWAGIPYWQ